MTEEERQKFIVNHQLCFYYLVPNHSYKECKTRLKCKATGCGERHATVHHNKLKTFKDNKPQENPWKESQKEPEIQPSPSPNKAAEPKPAIKTDATATCHSIRSLEDFLSIFIMPVHLSYGRSEEILTYALIDIMSDRSYVSRHLVDKIRVSESDITHKDPLTLYTMALPTTVDCELVSGLKIRGYIQGHTVKLPLMTATKNDIPINRKHIPT
jgi:hypothetical protein